jgi:hypothetical protein
MEPVAPTTTFDFEMMLPITAPSILMSPFDLISPSTAVPAPIRLMEEEPPSVLLNLNFY